MFPSTITIATNTDGATITTTGDSLTRRFVAFPVGKNIMANPLEYDFPLLSVPHQNLCRGSHKGWLVMVDKDMSMYLQNPFSGRRIGLPPVTSLPRSGFRKSKWDVHKAFMSVTPDSSSSSSSPPVSDCFVMVFYCAGDRVAFCKVGDQNWTKLRNLESYAYYRDAIYYKGRFYISEAIGDAAVKKQETLVYIDSSDSNGDGDYEREARKSRTCKFDEFDYDNSYVNRARNLIRRTTGFETFKLETGSDSSESKWIEVKDFEGGAVFIGLNQSFAVPKPDLMGYDGDRIYYTDDNVGGHKFHIRSGHDMGIFSLSDSRFEPLCSTDFEATKPPAVWITPSD
ncbi:hypothetical protein Vadar_005546 [Vaccinium darrowii]|uniref:Uncharacterized protein n=1 Tax=Vaccinium darrowii TaxID=229202 RepID=A0ACB7YJU2_9ERIC|nr:hypothetical protein Vadar_005546 [Vaccinium darrowii]